MYPPKRSRVPWALASAVGLASGLAGYVIHVAQVKRVPKQIVRVQRLTEMMGFEETPAISPDGKAVAFVAVSGSRRQVWLGAAITKDDADHFAPRWSADSGSLIYFAAGAIWEIPVAGAEARRLVDAAAPGDLSHDGKHLAFFRRKDGAAELMVGERSIIKVDGGTPSNLRWSPDDKKIAYLQDGNVIVVDPSGGEPVMASDSKAAGAEAVQGFTWAPDNSGLIVSTRGQLWFIPRKESGSPSQLTFGELSYESPDVDARGNVVVSRKGLYAPGESDIVMFTGLKW